MWFKNARIYTLQLGDELKGKLSNEQQLEEHLMGHAFRPCKAQEMASYGFAPLYGSRSGTYSFSHQGCHYFRLLEETKLLPASVIKTRLDELVAEKEQEQSREVRPEERQQLKSALINQLIAQAFAQRRDTYIWVDAKNGYCAVSAASAKRTENALAHLREALGGSFPAKNFSPRCVVEERMTSWVTDDKNLPQVFELGNDLTLRSPDDKGGTVRISKQDLTSEEIVVHIHAGKVATDMQLTYEDACSLVLGADLSLKRIVILDQYIERNLERTQDEIADLQAIMILQSDLLTSLSQTISRVFDCEA